MNIWVWEKRIEVLGTLGLTLDEEQVVEVGDSEIYTSNNGSGSSRGSPIAGGRGIVSKSSFPDERPPSSS